MVKHNKSCPNCGGKIDEHSARCSSCGMQASENEQFLRCCNGHIVPKDAQFCPWCGETVASSGSPLPQINAEKPSNERTKIMSDFGNKNTSPKTTLMNNADERKTVVMNRGANDAGEQRKTEHVQRAQSSPYTVVRRSTNSSQGEEGEAKITGFLVSYTLQQAGVFFPIREGRQTIGSDPHSRIYVKDQELSAEHAVLLYRRGRFIFEDKLSTNGSLLNGTDVIGQLELQHGDCLAMGSHTYWLVTVPASAYTQHEEAPYAD